MPFIYLFYLFYLALIPLDRTSRTMLKMSSESQHPCLFPILRIKAFILSPEYDFRCGFLYIAFYFAVQSYTQFVENFYYETPLNFIDASIEKVIRFLSFLLLRWSTCIICYVEPSLHSRDLCHFHRGTWSFQCAVN